MSQDIDIYRVFPLYGQLVEELLKIIENWMLARSLDRSTVAEQKYMQTNFGEKQPMTGDGTQQKTEIESESKRGKKGDVERRR